LKRCADFDVVGFEGDPARAQVARENGVTIVSGDWRKIADIVGTNRFDCIVSDQVFPSAPCGCSSACSPRTAF
jgi:hypothetical protein